MRMHSRDGFALPVALFVVGFLTIGVAAAFARVDNESRVNRDRDAEVDSYSVANSGLEYYLTNRRALGMNQFPPPAAESVRVNVPGGYADVVLAQVRAQSATAEALYFVRSRGTAIRGAAPGTPPAQRTVSQFTLFREEPLHVTGAWTSISGLMKNGTAGTLDGNDQCGQKPAVAGTAVPSGMWDNNGLFTPTGNPPVREMGTKAQMANDSIKINWDGIVNGNMITPDVVIPGNPWPSFADPNYWPVIRINGNYSIPTGGRGTLIVTGNLVITGSKQWQGIVLVGGTMTADGNNTVEGTVISGLNEQLGMTVGESAFGNGNKTYVYNSCHVASAMARISALRVIPGTYADNWIW